MSRHLIEKYRQRFAGERGMNARPWGGRLAVALVYPNTYYQGMSNLGLQTVYQMLNERDDCLCERVFLPDPEDIEEHRRADYPLVSIETQRPLADFDLIAFSLSFENDYINLPTIFELGRMPLWRTERTDRHPLVLCGGVCAFMNPEPVAEIMDLFVIGEAEVTIPDLFAEMNNSLSKERDELLSCLSQLPGIYLPKGYAPTYDNDGLLVSMAAEAGVPERIERQWLDNIDNGQSQTCIKTADTEFANMHLVEVSRGCPMACRFCAAGFIYRPFREHSKEHLEKALGTDKSEPGRVGLVAAAVSNYSELVDIGESVLSRGGEVSVSSVRIDAVTPEQVSVLAKSGLKTLALAPEAGSQRLRDLINKGVDEDQILNAVEMVAEGGIPNLKLYFMIGLPTETDDDVQEIVKLTGKIRSLWEAAGRQKGHLGRLQLSVNPFVPKPWTPLQWAPMEKRNSLEKKYRRLQKELRAKANLELNLESLRHAEIQGFLARGDRRAGRILPLLAAGKSLKLACRDAGLDCSFFLHRTRGADELFPWEIIGQGVKREHLFSEYESAMEAIPGYSCHSGCQRCGLSC